jgi:hypothetical protein
MLGFRTRSADRDRETDISRIEKLRQALLDVGTELAKEEAGLRRRYETASTDAAFSQQVYEDGRGDAGISSRIDDLTNTLINYSRRISELDRQKAFIGEMLVKLGDFATEMDAGANRPPAPGTGLR